MSLVTSIDGLNRRGGRSEDADSMVSVFMQEIARSMVPLSCVGRLPKLMTGCSIDSSDCDAGS